MNITSIIIFKANSGITLFSRNSKDVKDDLFSAFLYALKGFFKDLSLGGLSSFTTDAYIVFLASFQDVLTSVIVGKDDSSEKLYPLAYEISEAFHNEFKNELGNVINLSVIRSRFDKILDICLDRFDSKSLYKDIIKLYEIDPNSELKEIDFINSDQLNSKKVLIVVNYITKEILILENDENVANRLLFIANKEATNLNQREFKSEFSIQSITDLWDSERLINNISTILHDINLFKDASLVREKISKL